MDLKWVVEDSLNENNELVYSVFAEVRTQVKVKSSIPTSKKKNVWYHKPEWCIARDVRNPFTGKPSYEYASFLAQSMIAYRTMKSIVEYIDWRVPKDEKNMLSPFIIGSRIIRQQREYEQIFKEMPDRQGIFFDSTDNSDNIGIENDIGKEGEINNGEG
jgi:hypothetical protein